MKTITFSNDQLRAVRALLLNRIGFCEANIRECVGLGIDRWSMYWRDQLDIARQALALVDG